MKNGLTYIIFVIDRSGSMGSIKNDMIGGFNTFIKKQKEANLGECKIFAYKFDDVYEPMFENIDLNDVPLLDQNNYIPRGWTALYDAMGKTIDNIGTCLAEMKEEDRPEKVLVVTITDGEENSSRIFKQQDIADKITHQREVYKWDFAYIGANQDSWAVGSSIGYQSGTTLDYAANSAGTAYAFDTLCCSTQTYRSSPAGAKFSFIPEAINSAQLDVEDNVKNITPLSNLIQKAKKIVKKS